MLGWEYRDTDSEEDEESPHENLNEDLSEKQIHCLKQPVVVLMRLPEYQVRGLLSSLPQNKNTEDELSNMSNESDGVWEPYEEDSSGSEYLASDSEKRGKKRKKTHQKNGKGAKRHASPTPSTSSSTPSTSSSTPLTKSSTLAAKSSTPATGSSTLAAKSSTPATGSSTPLTKSSTLAAKSSTQAAKSSTLAAKSSTPAAKGSTPATETSTQKATLRTNPPDGRKTQNAPSGTEGTGSALSLDRPAKALAVLPDVTVGMTVLARKKAMRWYRGEIVEIINKENGTVKYKVVFENDLGKVLVSGHHIAFDLMLKLDHLPEMSRVLVRPPDAPWFCPGVLAERPGRKNRMRFLVFMDDHVPIYVSLPLIRLVCKPLPNPWDDISDTMQKNFLEQHTKWLANPPLTQCIVGQKMNAMFNGVQQKCSIVEVDYNLIQVMFLEDQHTEWIYRGSPRLEHIINMTKHLLSKQSTNNNKN